jgi:hypothetical protein
MRTETGGYRRVHLRAPVAASSAKAEVGERSDQKTLRTKPSRPFTEQAARRAASRGRLRPKEAKRESIGYLATCGDMAPSARCEGQKAIPQPDALL